MSKPLHHDNGRTHTTATTTDFLATNGMQRVLDPSYSPARPPPLRLVPIPTHQKAATKNQDGERQTSVLFESWRGPSTQSMKPRGLFETIIRSVWADGKMIGSSNSWHDWLAGNLMGLRLFSWKSLRTLWRPVAIHFEFKLFIIFPHYRLIYSKLYMSFTIRWSLQICQSK